MRPTHRNGGTLRLLENLTRTAISIFRTEPCDPERGTRFQLDPRPAQSLVNIRFCQTRRKCERHPPAIVSCSWIRAFIESRNGRLRDEHSNTHRFDDLTDAKKKMQARKTDYNGCRSYGALNSLAPLQYRAQRYD
ncbi:integrase core domain-containing protein [Candidatus Rariloculus sp.]|uniref:integrase core domain-containing protein n=1 Tax=Candidatus Rariloculus sp. TaxID=3101265 RepID=UPI003D0D62C3